MFVVSRTREGITSLPARELDDKAIRAVASPLSRKILLELASSPTYPMELSKRLKTHEQKVYYHIRKLEKAGVIDVLRTEIVQGTNANIYAPTSSSFVLKLKELEPSRKSIDGFGESPAKLLEPFIENGQMNCVIIVGSPDPHGPDMARSRDGYYGIDFALFLGSFLNNVASLNVRLDTEVHTEDLQKNLIILGGPVVNTITRKINDKLPIRFDQKHNWSVVSDCSMAAYHSDETGIIVRAKSPFNPKKQILVLAGKRFSGTRAVMIALMKYFGDVCKGNKHNPEVFAKVVEGVDRDADGIVDDAVILE